MPALYTTLARVYNAIYPHIFDYENEFDFYNSIFEKFKCRKILELACGTGLLAKYFIQAGYEYLGLDLHEEMLAFARKNNPSGKFIRGDMRHPRLQEKFDAVLIAGKSMSHLLTNTDILTCFRSIHTLLQPNGILVFDAYDANGEIGDWIDEGEQEVISDDEKLYKINGKYTKLLDTGWTARWELTYTLPDGIKITDTMDVRSYTMDELRLLLKLIPYEVKVVTTFTENTLITVSQKTQSSFI